MCHMNRDGSRILLKKMVEVKILITMLFNFHYENVSLNIQQKKSSF